MKNPSKRIREGDLIGKFKELKSKDRKRIQLKLYVNGAEIAAMLDTGSAIPLMSKNISKQINLTKKQELPKDRRFVDLNENDVVINKIFTAATQLNEAKCDIK